MRLGALVTTTRSDRPRLPRRRLLPEPGEAATRATPDEIPQPTRLKSDPMSFVLCPYNVGAQPRRPSCPAAAGCSAMLAGWAMPANDGSRTSRRFRTRPFPRRLHVPEWRPTTTLTG